MANPKVTLEELNKMSAGTMIEHLGIEYTEVGENFLCGKMPVDKRTIQPLNMLHGGASLVLAETLASVGGNLCIDMQSQYVAGLEINGNHLKTLKNGAGYVYGKACAVHLGKKTQVWSIEISGENGELVCISRMTLAVMDKK